MLIESGNSGEEDWEDLGRRWFRSFVAPEHSPMHTNGPNELFGRKPHRLHTDVLQTDVTWFPGGRMGSPDTAAETGVWGSCDFKPVPRAPLCL